MILMLFLKNLILSRKRKKRHKHKFILCLCCFLLIFDLTMYGYIESVEAASLGGVLAVGDALAVANSGGIVGTLLAPEVIIPMALVALGVAGIKYVANSNAVKRIQEKLASDYPEFVVLNGGKNNNDKRPFLKGFYKAGSVFLSGELLKIIYNIASELGIFDGLEENIGYGTVKAFNNSVVLSSNNLRSLGSFEEEIISMYPSSESFIKSLYSRAGRSNYGYIFLEQSNGNPAMWHMISSIEASYPITCSVMNGFTGNENIYYVDLGRSFQGMREEYINSSNHAVTGTTNGYYRYIPFGKGYSTVYNRNTGEPYVYSTMIWSSFGWDTVTSVSGIPVTDNLPYEEEGSVVLPRWNPATSPLPRPEPAIDDDALPVSVPDGYELPIIYPVGDNELPDFIQDPFQWPDNYPVNDPENPTPGAQEDAQEGDLDFIPSLDDNGLTNAGYNSFLVPESIKRKYPFCIPYDMYDIWCIIWYGDNPNSAQKSLNQISTYTSTKSILRLTPVYEWKPPTNVKGFENLNSVIIDLTPFENHARLFRLAVLILWVMNLILTGYKIATGGKE